jgi:uncharacterized membrane protein YkoI
MNIAVQCDCEASCDEAVLLETGDHNRQFYAELILAMVGDRKSNRTLLSTCFYGGKKSIKFRMDSVLSQPIQTKRLTLAVPVFFVALMALSGSVFAFNPTSVHRINYREALNIVLSDMNAEIDQISDLIIEEEWMDSDFFWEFYFTFNGERHNVYVHAVTGYLLLPYDRISSEEAIAAALAHANAELDDARILDVYIGVHNDMLVWEIVIDIGNTLTEFYVDIYSAEVIYEQVLAFVP